MEPNPAFLFETIRTQLKDLFEGVPLDPGSRGEWQEQVFSEVWSPLEELCQQISDLSQQNEHLQAAGEVLRAENERLRARLAGHREVENVVQQRAEAFRSLAENSPDVIMRLDRDLRHLYVNPMACTLAGISRQDFVGRTVYELDIYRPVDEGLLQLPHLFESGQEARLELPFPIEGETHWFDLRVTPERGADNQVETLLIVARDVTEDKRSDETMRRSEERFRIATVGAGMGVFEQDADLLYTWFNSKISGNVTPIGKRDEDIFPADEAAVLTGLKRQVLKRGESVRQELQLTTSLGKDFFDLMLEPIRDAQGRPVGIIGGYMNITGRKQVERELAYRARVLENVHDAIIATDEDANITSWNRAAEDLYGWKADEVLGRSISEVIPAERAQADGRKAQQPLSTGASYVSEIAQQARDGRKLLVECHEMSLMDESGQVTGFVNAYHDITLRHALEEEKQHHRAFLDHQRELLETIFEANPGGIAVVVGKDCVYQLANSAYRAVLPDPEMNPIGRRMDEVWPEKDGFSGSRMVKEVFEEQASITLEHVQRKYPDGTQRSFDFHARPIEWDGQPAAVLVTWETSELENALSSAQAAAEEAHRRAAEAEEGRRMLDALMEFIPEGIVISSAENLRVLYLSKYMAGMGTFDRVQAEGKTFEEYYKIWNLFHADGVTPLKLNEYPSIRSAREGEIVQDEEYRLGEPGRMIHLLVNAGPIRDADGHVFASVVVARDITERKRAEANQRFLTDLGRTLVALRLPEEVLEGVTSRLGEYLGVDRCFISEEDPHNQLYIIRKDYHPDLSSLVGAYPHGQVAARAIDKVRQGRMIMVADTASHPLTADVHEQVFGPISVRALAAAPMFSREGNWSGAVVVANRSPRIWRSDELTLLGSVADLVRLALENAILFQDLQEFRQRFEVALRNSPITVFTTDEDLRITWIFHPRHGFSAENVLGLAPEEINLHGDGEALFVLEQGVLESGQGVRRELRVLQGDVMTSHDITIEPLKDARGEMTGLTVAVMETTELRRMEAEAVRNLMRIEVQRRLIAERELERARIARELHDGPLQELIATNFNLVDAMNITEKDARLAKMRLIQGLLHKQIRELRQFCNELRPPVLAPFGLEKTIHAHVEGLQELYPNLRIHLNLEKDGQRLPEELRMTLFRVYQELMNNVIRHASATAVTIRFSIQGQRATLALEDNGVGFSSPENWVDFARKGHLGLVGVQERVQIMGGTVEIDSKPGDGTVVRVDIPFQPLDLAENKPLGSSG